MYSDFHKVKFCPELEISKIGVTFWHVAYNFWVAFKSESILVFVRYKGVKKVWAHRCKIGAYVWGAHHPPPLTIRSPDPCIDISLLDQCIAMAVPIKSNRI